MGKAVDMLKHFKANSVKLEKAKGMTPEELTGKIVVGEFANRERPIGHAVGRAQEQNGLRRPPHGHSKN